MFSSPRHFIVILALAAAAAQPAYAQDKNQDKAKDPKVVLDLEKSSPTIDSKQKEAAGADGSSHLPVVPPFGKACSAFGAAKDGYRSFDSPYSISELFGAPIEIITIRRLGPSQEKPRPRRTPQAHPRCAERTNHGSFPLRGLGRMGAARHRHHNPVLRPHQGRPGRIRRSRLLLRLRRHSLVAKNSRHAETIAAHRESLQSP